MLAMSGNEILMAPDAELGPIDPQMRTANGTSSAVAILELFRKAQAEMAADQSKLAGWMPIYRKWVPRLLLTVSTPSSCRVNWSRLGHGNTCSPVTRMLLPRPKRFPLSRRPQEL